MPRGLAREGAGEGEVLTAADPLDEAVRLVRAKFRRDVESGIILGTGLGDYAARMDVEASIDVRDIPGMPVPAVESHAGRLILGTVDGRALAVLQGRSHLYEGHSGERIAFPVRLLRRLGAQVLVVTFACGSLRPDVQTGDLVMLDDHINLQGRSPLVGPNRDDFGPRFPDMSEPYDPKLQERALSAAGEREITLVPAVYAAVLGPQLETRAEIRMLRGLGADVVGMSTVPEVIAARHAGMRVLGLGVVTNQCRTEDAEPVDVTEVLRVAAAAGHSLASVIEAVLAGD